MNIFWLSTNFIYNASLYNDQHCIKIILEITQCLMSAMHHHGRVYEDGRWKDGMTKVYKLAHAKHPVVLWITEHPNNFRAACVQALSLCAEYSKRRSKVHSCETLIYQLMRRTPSNEMEVPYKPTCVRASINIPAGCTPVPCCMPVEYIVHENGQPDLTASYINYYKHTKLRFASGRLGTWSSTGIPELFSEEYAKIMS